MKTPVIAIIEDSTIISEIVSHLLTTELEVKTITFDSAESAIREMDVYNPDLILLDHRLDSKSSNNMSGLQFLRKLELVGKSIPVIMMSGQRDKRVAADLLKSGIVNYLAKDDEKFLDYLLAEVKSVLTVLKLNEKQQKQEKDVKKRFIRVLALLLIPVVIIIICLYYQY